MAIAAGTVFGPYTIGKPLGAGGMGEVYEATDTRLRRAVAIKVLTGSLHDPERERDLEREARAVARLNHPNICVLHDVGQHQGHFFLVMERLSGESLAQRLERGALPLPQALDYAMAIADAVDAAHRARILHRDLKPANVMLTKSGPKLLDFGLAARAVPADALKPDVTVTAAASLESPYTFAGTLRYMAPERLEGKPAGVRSDIFAFGALLYEMVSGRPAFSGASQAAIVSSVLGTEPSPIEGLPAAVDRLMRRCLEKDPEDRWQSARDLREGLTLVRAATEGNASVRPSNRNRWFLPTVATLLSLLVLAAVALWLPTRSAASLPVIVLMDSPVPERVYDPETRKGGGTNADDITDTLRDLPAQLHKETTSAGWHREDEVIKQRPALVMMHLSSFAEPTTDSSSPLQQNAQERTRSFLGYVALAEPRTRFVVYSRGFPTEAERAEWVGNTEGRFPALKGRLVLMHIEGNEQASFRSPATRRAVHDLVKRLLDLH
ncbi:MAG: serine/threonine-protein kinase [Vicinamibacterales bacterium]